MIQISIAHHISVLIFFGILTLPIIYFIDALPLRHALSCNPYLTFHQKIKKWLTTYHDITNNYNQYHLDAHIDGSKISKQQFFFQYLQFILIIILFGMVPIYFDTYTYLGLVLDKTPYYISWPSPYICISLLPTLMGIELIRRYYLSAHTIQPLSRITLLWLIHLCLYTILFLLFFYVFNTMTWKEIILSHTHNPINWAIITQPILFIFCILFGSHTVYLFSAQTINYGEGIGLFKNSNFEGCSEMSRFKADSKFNEDAYIRVCNRFEFAGQRRRWAFVESPIISPRIISQHNHLTILVRLGWALTIAMLFLGGWQLPYIPLSQLTTQSHILCNLFIILSITISSTSCIYILIHAYHYGWKQCRYHHVFFLLTIGMIPNACLYLLYRINPATLASNVINEWMISIICMYSLLIKLLLIYTLLILSQRIYDIIIAKRSF